MDGSNVGNRSKGVTIIKPIIYGNVAKYFGKKREEDGHTHQWTVYIKPYKEEDISIFVKKVHFKLHESYGINQNRIINEPPYEITETGWGEFEIMIKIFFTDPAEKPITIYHVLKLFPPNPSLVVENQVVVSELYDELIFHEPTIIMHPLLTNNNSNDLPIGIHETDFKLKKDQCSQNISKTQNKINYEIKLLNDKLKQNKDILKKYQLESENLRKGV